VGTHESKCDHSPAAQVLPDKGIHSIPILELIEPRWQTFGLIVQGEHHLMHQREGASTRLRQHTGLSNPISKNCQLHCFRPISPEVISNRVGVCLGSNKMRIHAPGFGCTIEAHICEKGLKIKSCTTKSQHTAKEVLRLTLQRFSKILDLVEKKLLAVCSMRRLRQCNVDLGSNHLQLTLRILELVAQRSNKRQFA
jgi:hypothetical protein